MSAENETLTLRQLFLVAISVIVIFVVSFAIPDFKIAAICCLLGLAMLAISVSDLKRFIVPDVLSLPAIPAGLMANSWILSGDLSSPHVLEYGAAAIVGAASLYALRLIYLKVRGREGLGLGDVKLAAVAGSWTGLHGISTTLLLACVLALVFVAASGLSKKLTATTAIPFGTFFAPAIWIVWWAQWFLPG